MVSCMNAMPSLVQTLYGFLYVSYAVSCMGLELCHIWVLYPTYMDDMSCIYPIQCSVWVLYNVLYRLILCPVWLLYRVLYGFGIVSYMGSLPYLYGCHAMSYMDPIQCFVWVLHNVLYCVLYLLLYGSYTVCCMDAMPRLVRTLYCFLYVYGSYSVSWMYPIQCPVWMLSHVLYGPYIVLYGSYAAARKSVHSNDRLTRAIAVHMCLCILRLGIDDWPWMQTGFLGAAVHNHLWFHSAEDPNRNCEWGLRNVRIPFLIIRMNSCVYSYTCILYMFTCKYKYITQKYSSRRQDLGNFMSLNATLFSGVNGA